LKVVDRTATFNLLYTRKLSKKQNGTKNNLGAGGNRRLPHVTWSTVKTVDLPVGRGASDLPIGVGAIVSF